MGVVTCAEMRNLQVSHVECLLYDTKNLRKTLCFSCPPNQSTRGITIDALHFKAFECGRTEHTFYASQMLG